MAYTYDDFIKSANASGRMSRFTDTDLEVTKTNPEYGLSMLQLMKDEDEATSDDAKLLASSAMEQLRKNYGVENNSNLASFNYVKENDPNYQAFRKTYLREGERATGDALAKAAAATGGVPSSYAVTAAAQAGNYYASQLADKVPELQEMAYQRHQNDTAKYLESVALKIEGQQLQDQQKVDNAWKTYNATGYATPEIAAILGVEEGWAPSIKLEQDQQKIDNAWQLYSALGYATPEIAAILGVPEGMAPSVQQAQEQQQIDNAWKLYNALGYATPEIAAILGIPVGKPKEEVFNDVTAFINKTSQGVMNALGNWRGEDQTGNNSNLTAEQQEAYNDLAAIINTKNAKYYDVLTLMRQARDEGGITKEQYDKLEEMAQSVYGASRFGR